MKTLIPFFFAAGMALLAPLAQAQGIGHVIAESLSTVNTRIENELNSFEFQTLLSNSQPQLDGRTASFTQRMAWYGGLLADMPVSIITLGSVESVSAGYLLRFTVFDPGAAGYTLQAQSQLIGAMSGRIEGNSTASVTLNAFSVGVYEGGLDFTDLPTLATHLHAVGADTTQASAITLVNDRGSVRVGHYVGTHEFVFTVHADPHTLLMAASGGWAQGHLQFGRAPTLAGLQDGLFTGPGGLPIEDLGHFLSVTVEYAPALAVPEPGSAALLVAGVGLVVLRWRRSSDGGASV